MYFLIVNVEISYILLAQINGRPESKVRNRVEKNTTGNAKICLTMFPRTLEAKGGGILMHLIHTCVKYR